MLQKSQLLVSAHGPLQTLCPLLVGGNSFTIPLAPFNECRTRLPHLRTFVRSAAKDPRPQDDRGRSPWPRAASSRIIPTPYEIFKQKKGAPYSKRRFFELVKIYHPDRDIHEVRYPGCVSRATRLERYRLIIAANEILSDPVRRSAYDRWGAGWDGKPEAVGWAAPESSDGKEWSGFDDNSPMGNATWEDWEDWRQGKRRKQRPVYFSNGSFVGLIVIFALAGGYGEVSRANHLSRSLLQQIEDKHHVTSKELVKRRSESQELDNQRDRVDNFLRVRGSGYQGADDARHIETPRALPAPVHTSGGLNGQTRSAS